MDYDYLNAEINRIQQKYGLVDFNIDSECIYQLGDLSQVLQEVVFHTLPEKGIQIVERLSDDKQTYFATLSNAEAQLVLRADTHSDYLPDEFWEELESIPAAFGSSKRFYSINPAIGLTGQDAWYFCGTQEQLRAARQEGLPLIFPGEDYRDTTEYQQYGGS
jgi:hypothetical protein